MVTIVIRRATVMAHHVMLLLVCVTVPQVLRHHLVLTVRISDLLLSKIFFKHL